jgi:5-deoxy-glucuronate isomerase
MATDTISSASCVIRDTGARRGRTRSVEPGRTAARHLHFGRTVLGAGDDAVVFATGPLETGLVCLAGSAVVDVRRDAPAASTAGSYTLTRYDALYAPRGCSVVVAPGPEGCDLAELAAPVDGNYPVQFVAFADVQRDPGLHFKAGGPASERTVNILLGKNVKAGRIVAGVTFSVAGNWTSWPPHEHAAMLEEAYLYIDMPAPSFGVQLVYTDPQEPELVTIVRDGDVVLMPAGYHPNVAAPGGTINFLWMMAADREVEDRQFGVVNVQPDFAATPSGLDKGRADAK